MQIRNDFVKLIIKMPISGLVDFVVCFCVCLFEYDIIAGPEIDFRKWLDVQIIIAIYAVALFIHYLI